MTALESLRLGRFAEAYAALDREDSEDSQVAGLLSEALYGLGYVERAKACAERTLSKVALDHSSASRCVEDARCCRARQWPVRAIHPVLSARSGCCPAS